MANRYFLSVFESITDSRSASFKTVACATLLMVIVSLQSRGRSHAGSVPDTEPAPLLGGCRLEFEAGDPPLCSSGRRSYRRQQAGLFFFEFPQARIDFSDAPGRAGPLGATPRLFHL